jgi:hypothetical protein
MSFLDNLSNGVKEAGKAISSTTSSLSGQAKLTMEQSKLNGEIEEHYKNIGSKVYEAHAAGSGEPDIAGELSAVDAAKERIRAIGEEIIALKGCAGLPVLRCKRTSGQSVLSVLRRQNAGKAGGTNGTCRYRAAVLYRMRRSDRTGHEILHEVRSQDRHTASAGSAGRAGTCGGGACSARGSSACGSGAGNGTGGWKHSGRLG